MNKNRKKNKQYWMCIIGGVSKKELDKHFGADSILRQPVRKAFNNIFGEDEVCASGWGIDEERYEILRILDSKSTNELKKLIKWKKQ